MIIEREVLHRKLFTVFSIATVITLPFSVPLNGLAIILLGLSWIAEGQWIKKIDLLRKSPIALLFISFYLLLVIGLLYSSNQEQANKELEKQASLIAFPLIFATSRFVNRVTVLQALNAFLIACTVACLICLANGIYQASNGDTRFLFYHELGSPLDLHAVYFSAYVGLCIFYVIDQLRQSWTAWNALRKTTYVLLLTFLIAFLILLSSKTLIVFIFLGLLIFVARHYAKRKGVAVSAGIFVLCGIALVIAVFSIPQIKDRFTEVLVDPFHQTNPLYLEDYTGYHFTGGNMRLAIWKMLVGEMSNSNAWLFGVGTGDAQDVLTATYERKHVYPGDKELGFEGFLYYNAHNEFFQVLLTMGVVGLTVFVLLFVLLFRKAVAENQPVLFWLLYIFATFCLTESALEAQKGVVFFSFFANLLSSGWTK